MLNVSDVSDRSYSFHKSLGTITYSDGSQSNYTLPLFVR